MGTRNAHEGHGGGHVRSFGLPMPVSDKVTQQVVAPDDDFEIDPTETTHFKEIPLSLTRSQALTITKLIEEQLAEALLEIQRLEQEVASLHGAPDDDNADDIAANWVEPPKG